MRGVAARPGALRRVPARAWKTAAVHVKSSVVRPLARLAAAILALLCTAPPAFGTASGTCAGDCDGDGQVGIDELLQGVRIALTVEPLSSCASFDRDGDGEVSVAELLQAVHFAAGGCPPTATPTAEPTATPTINQAPILPALGVYRTFPDNPIALSIGAVDPDGGAVTCEADELPVGAALDGPSGLFTWTPSEEQLGPFYVPFTCTDEGLPPESAAGRLTFKVSPPDACPVPECDPASGCTVPLPPPDEPCCAGPPEVRVAEPFADCPEGRVAFIGQNNFGFGRLQNCDVFYVRNFAQTGAEARFHIEARCIDTLNRVTVRARMETAERLIFDEAQRVFFDRRPDGFVVHPFLRYAVNGPGPFFDMQDAEANLTLTLTDGTGASVSESIRLRLTFTPVPDRPDVDPSPAPTPTPTGAPPVS
jgi:hypothetical protein